MLGLGSNYIKYIYIYTVGEKFITSHLDQTVEMNFSIVSIICAYLVVAYSEGNY